MGGCDDALVAEPVAALIGAKSLFKQRRVAGESFQGARRAEEGIFNESSTLHQ